MKTWIRWVSAGVLFLTVTGGHAASIGHSGSREGLWEATALGRFSVGLGMERVQREVALDNGALEVLDSDGRHFFLGFDAAPWLTLYGAYGVAEVGVYNEDNNDSDTQWSVGLATTWWYLDIDHPEFMAGRYSIRTDLEYADYGISSSSEDGSWSELSASAILLAELFVKDVEAVDHVPYSMTFYVGPVYSALDGDLTFGAQELTFEEDSSTGFLLGTDVFIANNLSLSAQFQQMERASHRFGLTFHFR